MPEISEKQIGIMGEREPELCAVSGRPIRGKHATTHYKGDNVHYVRVLNQFDHLWNQAAPAYGFPVPEENSAQEGNVFVLPGVYGPPDIVIESNPPEVVFEAVKTILTPRRKPPVSNTEDPKESD